MQQDEQGLRLTLYGVVISALLALIKGTAGIFGHSYALIADAIESASDVFSSSLLFLGLWFARRPADDNHPYGHGRAEILATFMVVAFLMVSATVIALESWRHIRVPHPVPAPFTLVILLLVVIVKEALYRKLQACNQGGHSSALAAESWHHRSDALTSLAAFIGISIALWKGEGWEAADDWAALVAAGMIYYNAWLIFRPALADMMDEDRFEALRADIIAMTLEEPRILAVRECLVRKSGPHYSLELRICVGEQHLVCEMHALNKQLKKRLKERFPQLQRIFIELKPCV